MAPPLTTSTNLEAGATRRRSMRSITSPNWPAPPLCFLCRQWPSALLGDGLAIGNLRRAGVEFQLVLLLHAGQLRAQVHLADAANHHLVGGGVPLGPERRVFQLQLVQDVKQPLLVALASGLDREPCIGCGNSSACRWM